MPVNLRIEVVATDLPCRHGLFDLLKGIHAVVKTLTDQNIEFDLGHVEPTAMFGYVRKLDAVEEGFRFFGTEDFIEGAWFVGA
jgi:hypothetical protein